MAQRWDASAKKTPNFADISPFQKCSPRIVAPVGGRIFRDYNGLGRVCWDVTQHMCQSYVSVWDEASPGYLSASDILLNENTLLST